MGQIKSIGIRSFLRLYVIPALFLPAVLGIGVGVYLYITNHYKNEFSDRTLYSATVNIERVEFRPAKGRGVLMSPDVIFHVKGQVVEYDNVQFHAAPGDPIKIHYMVGASGKVYIQDINPAEQ
ncbi:hypothetical protein ACFPTO_08805 [Paraburkholderia denitrificans]|uniref:DUF3592 domain-containing protein n=1 Tax=Paraburkholderia denitrificans TaxID=694025 RepID=A0ABW0J771_9BURK